MSNRGFVEKPKKEGFSSGGFYSMMIFMIILAIILIIVLVLYFQQDGSRIDPANCPEAVSGILVNPDTKVSTAASNCGNEPSCIFTVNKVSDAVLICKNLGATKCAAFSLEQQPASDDFTMTISDSIATDVVTSSDTFRIIN